MLQLKDYQKQVLESLQMYFQECSRLQDADQAFYLTTRHFWKQGLPYAAIKSPSELADIPYVCLRLPTGGGKTLLACYTVGVANRAYLGKENSLVLWLVPSNAIREQTLTALKDHDHPYRQALESTLSNVTVLDLGEALYLRQGQLLGSTVIIIATLQAFRVEDKVGRKVYETDGALKHHFQNLPREIMATMDRDEKDLVPYSLANVMRIHRPLIIVDEAHNARTELSFDTLARFRPSAIVEFTATPDKEKNPSNVLHSISAAALKTEDMIKLPIRLETNSDWQSILSDAISQRVDLEEKAKVEKRKSGDYIRPIMLIQAQPRRQGRETLSVEIIEKSLFEDHRIPEDQVARATGEDRGLEGINLLDENCPIRYIITIQALREGWDCPFAYVLCSVHDQRAAGAVEQILGRILRLPYYKSKTQKELEMAYAFVASSDFEETARNLVDALVENGFNKQEAQDALQTMPPKKLPLFDDESAKPGLQLRSVISFEHVPDLKNLTPDVLNKIDINPEAKTITLKAVLSSEDIVAITRSLSVHEAFIWADAVEGYREQIEGMQSHKLLGSKPLQVPALCIARGEQLAIFEEDHICEAGWNLGDFDPELTEQELNRLRENKGQFGEIDIGTEGKVSSKFISELQNHLNLIETVDNWTDAQLIHWLDKNLFFQDLPEKDREIFLTTLIGDLLDQRGMALAQITRKKFEILKVVENKIKGYRTDARKKIYQELLFGNGASDLIVSPDKCFSFEEDKYPYRFACPASDAFRRHYYPKVGDLEDSGEEFLCARFIDQMPQTDCWVRNLERQERFSFWLQTASDKFYPDFICRLNDGRFLAVEYKGEHLWSNDDSKEKRRLGELWALKSNRRCIFIMPKGKDWETIKSAIKK